MALVAGSGFKAVAGGQAAVSWVGARGGFRSGDEVFRGFDSGSGCGLMVLLRYWLDLLQVLTMSLRLRPRHRLRLQQPPSVSSAAPTTKTRKICVFFFRSEHFFPDLTKRRPPSTRWRWWWSHILSDGVVGKATAVVVRHGDGGLKMKEHGNEEPVFEIGVVIPRRVVQEKDESCDCAYVLVKEFEKVGFVVERVIGIADEFIKLAAPLETLGRAAAELQIKKQTLIGMDLQFEVEEVEAFVKQPDGSVFSWYERFQCYCHLIYGTVNNSKSVKTLKFDGKEIHWEIGENLLLKLESLEIVKQVFPLHDEKKRKKLLRSWALQWSLKLVVLPIFFIMVILWAIMFSQFWKRKNSALLARWPISSIVAVDQGYKISGRKSSSWQPPMELMKVFETDRAKEKEIFQRHEWLGRLMRFRNDAIIIFSIICLQLPFELAYAHLYEVLDSDIIKFGLTAIYLFAIQYITKIGGKVSVKLIMNENNENTEKRADSLVYKKNEKGEAREKFQFSSRVEKEYLKPSYSASIGEELEDGLFDDFLELALQFGMILMFACAFPPAFAFAAVNNLMEIRTDALKLLVILRRPVPRAAATVGAWLNIFQFLILMSICTNCALLAWLYDEEGKWKIEPGLAAILIMEHVLLLTKFGFSRFIPEEPAWVRANRAKHTTQAQDMCSKKLLRTISGGVKTFREEKKLD
ncbi:hypothetical protein JHK85_022321 [Glycine max]|nr:hypothetical protein JHK85_022321 [Glycine max]